MLKVIRANGQALVNDLGRWGYQYQGVPIGGVMDPVSLRVGNWALGNNERDACLELMGQFELLCSAPCKVLLASRGGHVLLNRQQATAGRVYALEVGDVLRILGNSSGVWSMLCIAGGINTPLVLGSRSTCMAASLGGFDGRSVHVGDAIPIGHAAGPTLAKTHTLAMPTPIRTAEPGHAMVVPCLPGLDWDALGTKVQQAFVDQTFTIQADSSRMGYRLCGDGQSMNPPTLLLKSHVVLPGLVQLPPSGHPILLMAEAQVTGGYPRLAVVPECVLWTLAHCVPGSRLRFEMLNWTTWAQLDAKHQRMMKAYRHVIECHLD